MKMQTTILTKALWRLQIFNSATNKSGLFDYATIISSQVEMSEDVAQIATDGTKVIINPVWFPSRPIEDQIFALSHEAVHIQQLHPERRGNRDPDNWNIAVDFWTNTRNLKDGHKPSREIYILPEDYNIQNFDPMRYTVEQIYDMLPANTKQKKKKPDDNGSSDQPGQGNAKPSLKSGTDVLEPPTANKATSAQKLETIKQVAVSLGMDPGKISGDFMEQYGIAHAPEKDWKTACWSFVAKLRESHWSMQKIMPSYRARRIIMPAIKRSNKLEFGIIIDTSGSIEGPQYSEFIAVTKDAFSQLRPERMIAVLADAKVQDVMEFDKLPQDIPFKGRGGTDFRPAIKYFEDNHPDIGGVMYLTDTYGDFPDEAPEFPMLWVVNNHQGQVPWGDICRI